MTSIMEQNETYPQQLQHKLDKITVDEKLAEAKEKLRHEIKRSVSIFRTASNGGRSTMRAAYSAEGARRFALPPQSC